VCAAAANCGVHAGKKFNTEIEECVNISINIILPVYFAYTPCAIKYADNNRKN
jgi:hypothetical protein